MQPTEIKGLVQAYIKKYGYTSRRDLVEAIPFAKGSQVSNAISTLKRNGAIELNADGKYGEPTTSMERLINSKPWNSRLFA
tara:strand:+ start:4072 stop:4314 length:243 start_codon:yes stop_codon:yes gene_type:complete